MFVRGYCCCGNGKHPVLAPNMETIEYSNCRTYHITVAMCPKMYVFPRCRGLSEQYSGDGRVNAKSQPCVSGGAQLPIVSDNKDQLYHHSGTRRYINEVCMRTD